MSSPTRPNPVTAEAVEHALAALALAQRSGLPWALAEARLTLARGYRQLGAPAVAATLLSEALAAAIGNDQRVELLCERADTLMDVALSADAASSRAALEQARDHIFEAAGLAARVADSAWEVTVLLHLSDLLNQLGDHEDAAVLQSRALGRMAQAPATGWDFQP